MTMLPRMIYAESPQNLNMSQFAGLDHNLVVQQGKLWDMVNMTVEDYPAISTRRGRHLLRTLTKPNGLGARDKLFWVDGETFYYDGSAKGAVTDSHKTFAQLGVWILIFPDKVYYNTATDTFGQMAASWSGSATITHYAYDAEAEGAEVYQGNAIRCVSAVPFEVGEAITISGSRVEGNNRTPVIQDILEDGKLLVFTNNLFEETAAERLTMEREIPDMDYLCENGNRLFGCKGDEIFVSYMGSPFRWKNLGTTAMDSWYVQTGSKGDFTAAFTYGGYPIFFKPEVIHKLYGTKPSNFATLDSATMGVMTGGGKSLAVAGENLYFLNRQGVVQYSGGIPYLISQPLGPEPFEDGVGGSDGRRYYLSAKRSGKWNLYCFDTLLNLWSKEDADLQVMAFAQCGGTLHMLLPDGRLYELDGSKEDVPWMIETGDFTDGGGDKAKAVRFLLRITVESGNAECMVQFNSCGKWERAGEIMRSSFKQTHILPIIPRRCDHFRLRIQGHGRATIYNLTRELHPASMI